MDANNIQGSLDRLQQILSGRTITDLLSIVDTKMIPQPAADETARSIGLDSSQTESKSILVFCFLFLSICSHKLLCKLRKNVIFL